MTDTTPPPSAATPVFPVTFGDVGWMLLAAGVFAVIVAGAAIGAGAAGLDFSDFAKGQAFVVLATLVQATFMIGCVYFIAMRRRGLDWRGMGLRPVSRRWWVGAIVIALAGIPVVGLLTAGVQTILDRPISSPQAAMLAPDGFSWFGAAAMLLGAGVAAPFAEELVFRGVLYKLLRKYWAVLPAAVVSALLFGGLHGFAEIFPGTTLIGLVLALTYEKSGSLWVPVVIHGVYNSTSTVILFTMLGLGLDPSSPT